MSTIDSKYGDELEIIMGWIDQRNSAEIKKLFNIKRIISCFEFAGFVDDDTLDWLCDIELEALGEQLEIR